MEPVDARLAEPEVPQVPPEHRLYTPQHVGLATFLGTPLAGAYLLARNYWSLGKSSSGWNSLGLGVLGTILILAVAALIPSRAPTTGITIGLVFGMMQAAKGLQQKEIDAHVARQGRLHSGWRAAGVGLLGCAVVIVGIFAWVMVGPEDKATFGAEEEVYFEDGATEAEARKVGEALKKAGYFDDTGAATVTLARSGGGYTLEFVVQDGAWNDAEVVTTLRQVGDEVSKDALDGKPVAVRLCDWKFQVKKEAK